jgi:hypothetical protein
MYTLSVRALMDLYTAMNGTQWRKGFTWDKVAPIQFSVLIIR